MQYSERLSAPLRAGVFIGVQRYKKLPPLYAACRGARDMHDWAVSQGIVDGTHALLITDEGGREVGPDEIYTAIERLHGGPGLDQLIVYFAGHGIITNQNERWLLSKAPDDPNAAVNVTGSVELARTCGIRHVTFISDACRTAAKSLQMQAVKGAHIFPNLDLGGETWPVDQFYACRRGRSVNEIPDPQTSAGDYRAIYTEALLDGLHGRCPEVLEAPEEDDASYVFPAPLGKYLLSEVPDRFHQAKLQVDQQPEALIMVHDHWLSKLPRQPPTPAPDQALHAPPSPPAGYGDVIDQILSDVLGALLPTGTSVDRTSGPDAISSVVRDALAAYGHDLGSSRLANAVFDVLTLFGPDDLPSSCGIKVRGTEITECHMLRMHPSQRSATVVEIDPNYEPAGSAAVQFTDGAGTVVPVFADHFTALTVRDGELVDVGFEPVRGVVGGSDKARVARALLAAGAQDGRLSLSKASAESLLRLLDEDGSTDDPAFVLYAIWALHDRQEEIPVAVRQSEMLIKRFGVTLFDVALLGRLLRDTGMAAGSQVIPLTPLFSRAWALLDAHRYEQHPLLNGLEATVLESPWSLYSADGYQQLRSLFFSRDVR